MLMCSCVHHITHHPPTSCRAKDCETCISDSALKYTRTLPMGKGSKGSGSYGYGSYGHDEPNWPNCVGKCNGAGKCALNPTAATCCREDEEAYPLVDEDEYSGDGGYYYGSGEDSGVYHVATAQAMTVPVNVAASARGEEEEPQASTYRSSSSSKKRSRRSSKKRRYTKKSTSHNDDDDDKYSKHEEKHSGDEDTKETKESKYHSKDYTKDSDSKHKVCTQHC